MKRPQFNFAADPQKKTPTFGSLEVGDWFLDEGDYLCIKLNENESFNIATPAGWPTSFVDSHNQKETVTLVEKPESIILK